MNNLQCYFFQQRSAARAEAEGDDEDDLKAQEDQEFLETLQDSKDRNSGMRTHDKIQHFYSLQQILAVDRAFRVILNLCVRLSVSGNAKKRGANNDGDKSRRRARGTCEMRVKRSSSRT